MYQYIERDSFIHALNPMVKFLGIGILTLSTVFFLTHRPILLMLAVTLLMLIIGAKISPWQIIKGIGPLAMSVIGFMWVNMLFSDVPGRVLWEWGILDVTTGSVYRGIVLGVRVLVFIALGYLFSATTSPRDMVVSMVQQARVPYKLAFGMYIALRFLPLMSEEMANLQAVQRVRGGEVKGLPGRIRAFRQLLIPLFMSVIRKSIALGIAMESKAFGAYPTRTYLAQTFVTWRDGLFIAFTILFVISLFFI